MYRKVIVGHDLHEGGEDALALGKLIADATDAKLVVAAVFPFGALPRGFEASWREEEVAIASEIDRIAESVGAEPEAFPAPSPAHGLHGLADEIGADLVVVGSSRHSSLGQVLAGNVGARPPARFALRSRRRAAGLPRSSGADEDRGWVRRHG